ncbi:hypothetical protein BVJ53_09715 [Lacticaseibacillus chiayiensis]|uniref:Blp family class II bacteriocin n=1 Tax=Lacticaseibacillus chiayiensis TaxID=2100821 RepID=A0A4Q1TRX5_9LACO|nr:Blp family class II bacteriocin [Lacticaseibacillus chiayiensis]QVI34214.1 Blp family class II bacteriocin [Lacticaseibacillus chiayiensis]RXT20857.1 hypothetical protein BVJ53_09715 [Lacticaseibacillus chiayiensis]RXT57933.1 hypothetical protein CHT97_09345 [Lacticaseibacillus chiayiensis]UYN55994.1 Blp family class II bacteriocin [Lacticaseibacillus chiayiensis]
MKNQILSEEQLTAIFGGYSGSDCLKAIGGSAAIGAIKGGVAGTAFTVGIGTAAGAFLGAHLGAIGGGAVCIGGLLLDKH